MNFDIFSVTLVGGRWVYVICGAYPSFHVEDGLFLRTRALDYFLGESFIQERRK